MPVGSLPDVHINHVVDDYDFDATLIRVSSSPSAILGGDIKRVRRTLPLMVGANASSVGSLGR